MAGFPHFFTGEIQGYFQVFKGHFFRFQGPFFFIFRDENRGRNCSCIFCPVRLSTLQPSLVGAPISRLHVKTPFRNMWSWSHLQAPIRTGLNCLKNSILFTPNLRPCRIIFGLNTFSINQNIRPSHIIFATTYQINSPTIKTQ